MTISIKHKFVNPKSDTADTTVSRASDWNDEHDITLAQNRVLGRISAANGPVEELTGEQIRTISDTTQAGVLVGINTRTASYTLAASDRGKIVEMNVASANTVTIPNETGIGGVNYPIGTQIKIAQLGTGQTTLLPAAGVTARSVTGGLSTSTRYGALILYKRASNDWFVIDQTSAYLDGRIDTLETLSGNAANVTTVATNIASVNTVSTNIDSVNTTATNVASVNNFSSVYLGARTSDPSTRTNGSALQAGDMYFNTAQNRMKAWGGAAWYNTETAGATSANLVTSTPSGFIGSSNVQAALNEIASDIAATTGAGLMGSTATGYVSASTVQGTLDQIVAATPVTPWESIKIRMRLGRVDFVGIGDSNQIFGGNGWDHGIQYALSQQFSMWATGLVSQNENNGSGAAQGYGYTRFGALMGAISGAPADLDKFLNKGSGALFPAYYTYVADGSSIANNFGCGLILNANCIIDNGAALSFDIHYGTFTTGAGEFRASVRLEEPPYSLLVSNTAKSTNTGAYGMAVETVSLTADGTRASKAISLKPISTNVTGITGPYFNTYYRARNPSRTTGWSYGTLDYRGGQSLRTMAYDVQQASDETLTHYFSTLRNDQGSTIKTIVICVNSGLNDRNETLASVGTGAVTPGDSAAAFVDNYKALRDRILAIWTANSWDQNELFWLVYVSHPITAPDDSELIGYRTAIFNYARGLPRTQVVSMTDLTTSTEMLANSWYVSAGDKQHLSTVGYEQLGTRIIDKLQ